MIITIRLSCTVSDLIKLPLTGNDVKVLSPLGGAAGILLRGIWKGDPDFILVVNNNHTSIVHRFQNNQVLPLTGNDVFVLSSLGSAAGILLR